MKDIETAHVSKVQSDLYDHQQSAPWEDIPEGHFPVRLQVLSFEPFDYNVKVGDPGFDKDHSGYWGSSFIGRNDSGDKLAQIARDLLSQALNHYSQLEVV